MAEASLQSVVSMPRGGNLLDSIQSNRQTINTFNQIDSDTVHGVFAGSFNTFHQNKRPQGNRFTFRNRINFSNTDNYKQNFHRSTIL